MPELWTLVVSTIHKTPFKHQVQHFPSCTIDHQLKRYLPWSPLKYHYFFQTWWLNHPSEKNEIFVKLDHFPQTPGEDNKNLVWVETTSWATSDRKIHPLVIPIPSPTSSTHQIGRWKPETSFGYRIWSSRNHLEGHSSQRILGHLPFFLLFLNGDVSERGRRWKNNLTVAWTLFFFFASFFCFSEATWGCWNTFVNFISWISYPKSSEFIDVMRISLVLPWQSARKFTNLGKIWLSCKKQLELLFF